jgi:hypothetical protein
MGTEPERYSIDATGERAGRSFGALDAYVAATSDNQAAEQLNHARDLLFQSIHPRPKSAAGPTARQQPSDSYLDWN